MPYLNTWSRHFTQKGKSSHSLKIFTFTIWSGKAIQPLQRSEDANFTSFPWVMHFLWLVVQSGLLIHWSERWYWSKDSLRWFGYFCRPRCHRHNREQPEWSERKRKMQLGPKIKKPVKQANSDKFYNFLQLEKNNKNFLQFTKIPALLFVSIIYLL